MQIEIENDINKNAIIAILSVLAFCFLAGILFLFFSFNAKLNKIQASYSSQTKIHQEKSNGNPTDDSLSSDVLNITSGNINLNSIASSSRTHKNTIPNEITSIAGIVKKIEGRSITVETNLYGEVKDYIVTIGKNTQITKKEAKKGQFKPSELGNVDFYDTEDAIFTEILQYDVVEIDAKENVKNKNSFEAKSISIIITEFSEENGNLFIKEISNSPR